MAVLSEGEQLDLRQRLATKVVMRWTKAELAAAFQAMEDWFESVRASGGQAIENAVPGRFTNAQKIRLFAAWLLLKAGREGA